MSTAPPGDGDRPWPEAAVLPMPDPEQPTDDVPSFNEAAWDALEHPQPPSSNAVVWQFGVFDGEGASEQLRRQAEALGLMKLAHQNPQPVPPGVAHLARRGMVRQVTPERWTVRRGKVVRRIDGLAGADLKVSPELRAALEHAKRVSAEVQKTLRLVRLHIARGLAEGSRAVAAATRQAAVLRLADIYAGRGAAVNGLIARKLGITRDAVGKIRRRAERGKSRPH